MDELEISGKRYISTRRAAREHGYHSDYMGQLIRGKKVAGQKVGRAWYIEEDSLNAYLGKAPVPAPTPATAPVFVAEALAPTPAPAPVERLIIEEPAPAVVLEPETIAHAVAPEPMAQQPVEVEVVIEEESQPIVVHIEPQTVEPMKPVVQEIHHAPYIQEHETRIPIHTPVQATQETGGLRYAHDDTPSIPVVTRMPQTYAQAYAPAQRVPAQRAGDKFPYVGLSLVGIIAILGATFASNFISATMVSEEGKAATVQYAIHW